MVSYVCFCLYCVSCDRQDSPQDAARAVALLRAQVLLGQREPATPLSESRLLANIYELLSHKNRIVLIL